MRSFCVLLVCLAIGYVQANTPATGTVADTNNAANAGASFPGVASGAAVGAFSFNGFPASCAADNGASGCNTRGGTFASVQYTVGSGLITWALPTDITKAGTINVAAGSGAGPFVTSGTAAGTFGLAYNPLVDLLVFTTGGTNANVLTTGSPNTCTGCTVIAAEGTLAGFGSTGAISHTHVIAPAGLTATFTWSCSSAATTVSGNANTAGAVPFTAVDPATGVTSSALSGSGYGTGAWDVFVGVADDSNFAVQSAGFSPNGANTVPWYTGTVAATYTYNYVIINGDPQFVGFQGQQFQIHGVPEEYFALVSTPDFFINSRFVYLANGVCNYNDTECFSHPGTYIDQLGFGMPDVQIKLIAGTHAHGMTAYLNGEVLNIGARVLLPLSNTTYVHVVSKSRVVVALDEFVFGVSNSDYFFNIAAQLSNADVLAAGTHKLIISSENQAEAAKQIATTYKEHQIHGLLGQTWRNIQWPQKKMIQGDPTDYQISSLFNPDFPFTQYQPNRK